MWLQLRCHDQKHSIKKKVSHKKKRENIVEKISSKEQCFAWFFLEYWHLFGHKLNKKCQPKTKGSIRKPYNYSFLFVCLFGLIFFQVIVLMLPIIAYNRNKKT